MRISYEWLSDFVDLDGVTPKDAAEVLTRLGLEVESLTVVDLSEIVVGKVLEQIPHPKSRNPLWVHQVDLGDRVEQIIAGAPNAVPGSLVPVALPGTTVPNGKLVKDMNIAGYKARGMLCSAEELLLGDDHSGILILEAGKPGDPLTSVIPSQAILEAEVTSNRPDCMGHLGVARELAAGLDRPLKRDFMPAFTGTADPPGRDLVKVSIDEPDLCSRYIGGVIKGVKVGPSPDWLQRRLRACGVRPINNIVDITNYVLLEYAQPLHAFDLAKLAGSREVHVRRAQKGEKLLCLDGIERELTAEMLVIADAKGPVAIAGIIGGEESAVTDATTDILLEAATFSGPSVRQTARELGLRTEASARFEKGLPAELALAGARRAASLIAELAGGQRASRVGRRLSAAPGAGARQASSCAGGRGPRPARAAGGGRVDPQAPQLPRAGARGRRMGRAAPCLPARRHDPRRPGRGGRARLRLRPHSANPARSPPRQMDAFGAQPRAGASMPRARSSPGPGSPRPGTRRWFPAVCWRASASMHTRCASPTR